MSDDDAIVRPRDAGVFEEGDRVLDPNTGCGSHCRAGDIVHRNSAPETPGVVPEVDSSGDQIPDARSLNYGC